MQDLNHLFEDLKHANQAGVYRLVNKAENSCYILQSSNMAKSLVRLLSSNLFFPEFEFEILELVPNLVNLRPRCQFYKDLQSSNGWTIINPNRVSNCKIVISPLEDFRVGRGGRYLFEVKIKQGAWRELTVGIFNDYSEVESFLSQNYPSNKVYKIIESSNELTREYLKLNE
jgi:hypothetical protein